MNGLMDGGYIYGWYEGLCRVMDMMDGLLRLYDTSSVGSDSDWMDGGIGFGVFFSFGRSSYIIKYTSVLCFLFFFHPARKGNPRINAFVPFSWTYLEC